MGKNKREFIMEDLMEPGIMEKQNEEILLEEMEKGGESRLRVHLASKGNLCITNVDRKRTDMQFFKEDRTNSMYKRVDHMIFERLKDGVWRLHLIEMKGSVGTDKWSEIKGKFRASFLLGQAIGAMLEMQLSETVMYTTFEKVRFGLSSTIPSARRGKLGEMKIRMEEEWDRGQFGLNFGQRVSFIHRPIQMKRNEEGILEGDLTLTGDQEIT